MDLKQLRNGGTLQSLLAQLGENYEPERLAAALKEREFEMAARAAGVVTGFGTWLARITAVRPGGLGQQAQACALTAWPSARAARCHATLHVCHPGATSSFCVRSARAAKRSARAQHMLTAPGLCDRPGGGKPAAASGAA